MKNWMTLALLATVLATAPACGKKDTTTGTGTDGTSAPGNTDTTATNGNNTQSSKPTGPLKSAGCCTDRDGEIGVEYKSSNATADFTNAMKAGCPSSNGSTWTSGACSSSNRLGRCTVDMGSFTYVMNFYAASNEKPESMQQICGFNNGTFERN